MSITAPLREFQALTPQQWLERATRTLPAAVAVVLTVTIAWQLVQLTWMLLDNGAETSVQGIGPAPATASRKGADISSIVRANLFGAAEAERKSAVDAPQTQMNLILSAVFASSDPSKGLAIIGESAANGKVFAVGGTVRPGTRLHAVYLDKVVLDRGGTLETLSLPRQPSVLTPTTQRTAVAPTPSNTQFADNLRRIAETNPSAITDIMRPQAVYNNGVQRGFRVYPGRDRQRFQKLGLQPGDLVLAVNGTPLDDPSRGQEIFNTSGSSDRVTVTIERNGQPQELTLNTAQIALPDPGSAPNNGARGGPASNPSNPAQPVE
jgi:general secretion pathway protein C